MALVLFTVSSFILSLPAYFAQLQTICSGDLCVYSYGRLTPGNARALQHLGLSISSYAASVLALAIASVLVFFGVAGGSSAKLMKNACSLTYNEPFGSIS